MLSATCRRLSFVGFLLASSIEAQTTTAEALQRIDIVLGSWDVDDVYRTRTGSQVRETGTRTCSMVMRNRYIECVTLARNANGIEREYRWFITWNGTARRYEILGMFSNTPMKLQQTFRVDSTGMLWNIRSRSSLEDDGVEQWGGAQLKFESRDRALWIALRNFDTRPVTEWEESTRETWTRRRRHRSEDIGPKN